jgi:flagellar FliL protein
MKRLALIVVPVILVVALLAVGAYFIMGSGGLRIEISAPGAEAGAADHAAPPGSATPEPAHATGILYSTRERVVNLMDTGVYRYLKVQVVLELAEPKGKPEQLKGEAYQKKQEELTKDMAARSALIEDALTTILSAKSSAELLTPDGKAGLRQEMLERLRPLVGEYRLLGVYFITFIIQ